MILLPLQKALFARLRADATLMALAPGGAWSGSVPPGTARPYLVLNEPSAEDFPSFGGHADMGLIKFDTWSPTTVKSTAVVDGVLDRVELLLRTTLPLDGHTNTEPRRDGDPYRGVFVEEDDTRHGWMRYRFLAGEA